MKKKTTRRSFTLIDLLKFIGTTLLIALLWAVVAHLSYFVFTCYAKPTTNTNHTMPAEVAPMTPVAPEPVPGHDPTHATPSKS